MRLHNSFKTICSGNDALFTTQIDFTNISYLSLVSFVSPSLIMTYSNENSTWYYDLKLKNYKNSISYLLYKLVQKIYDM